MATPNGIVRIHQQDRTLTFQVEGRAIMHHSLPVRRCAEHALECGTTCIRFDLRSCNYMDSTFLGTLLTLKRNVAGRPGSELILITPSEACCRVLRQMGVLDMLPIQSVEVDPAAVWTELVSENPDAGSFKRNIAQAHEELACLPGPAGEQFKAVARCMGQAEKPRSGGPPATAPRDGASG